MLASVAAVFVVAALASLHVMVWAALRQYAGLSGLGAASVVFGIDLVCTILFGLLAAGARHDPVAREARDLRDQSIRALRAEISGMLLLRLVWLALLQSWRGIRRRD
jgi:hypothetical protein